MRFSIRFLYNLQPFYIYTHPFMKKLLFAASAIVLLAGLGACSNRQAEEEAAQAQDSIAQLSQEYQQATNFNDSLMLLMGDIYTGLDSINTQEKLLYAPATGDNANRRAEISQNLSAIKARLNANRQLLAQMEQRLKSSNNNNAVLQRTITQLKSRLDAQEQTIAGLQKQLADANTQIGQLNTQVAETQEQVRTETAAREEAQQQVVEANNELNTVYYAIGTNQELKKQGLLAKKFLGATKVLKEGFNANYFTKADKRNLTSIPTNGKKVKIWTNMPVGSYQIVNEANGTQSISITDPAKFWSLTPYLIVQIDR